MTMTDARISELKLRAAGERDRTGYPDGFPELPPVPAARYRDPEFAALERDTVFGRTWLFAGHRDQVAAPGDFVRIDHLAVPIVVVHGHDGVIRAHVNACRHRGSTLLLEPSGNTGRRMTCPYHSWSYDLDGQLVGMPDAPSFTALAPACVDLTAVRCETWGPLVFVNLDPDAGALLDHLGAVADDLGEMATLHGRLHLAGSTVRDVPVNWKLPVDANIETYHVNTVHRNSAGRVLDQVSTGIQLLGNGHSRMLITVREGMPLIGAQPFPAVFEQLGDLPDSGTFSYHVFPNLSIVFVGKGFVFLITNWPKPDGTSSYHVHWCSSVRPDTEDGRRTNDKFIGFNQDVLFEDLTVLPGIQTSIDTGAVDVMNLSYQERRIYHVHEAIDRTIGVERIPEAMRVPALLGPFVEA